ncbi:restriction endonuclease subunit S [Lactobacillus mulieris]|uniref:restriction endonuclease subunit S n=1 Tax=Lactobacillus mulieris TaxID=2508708 RepID=UPI0028E492AB|nr:restriction endonuclease subunit S [Lactobacillus mulieris]MDT9629060.1 restriction endonuclease subunit S [Lactobacillus mulieris]
MTDDLMKSSGSGDADNSTHADEQRLYPKVRFRGFDEPWKKVKARQLFISKSKKNYPALPVLSASQELGMIYRSNLDSDIKTERSGLKNYKLIEPGDFVIHLRSFQGGFAYSDKRGIASPAYTVFTFKDKTNHDDYFWKEKFQTYNFIQLLKQVTYGIRDGKSISYSDFSTLKLTYTSKKEQVQISKCLKQINSLLSLQQRKLELESLLYKHLKRNCFYNNYNFYYSKPKKLNIKMKDIITLEDNQRIPVSENNRKKGITPYYGANGIQDYVDGYTHVGQYILIAEDGASDIQNYPVIAVNGKVWINNHAHVLKVNKTVDFSYLLYFLKNFNYFPWLVGSGRFKLNAKTLLNIKISIDSNTENQRKIGVLLNECDSLTHATSTRIKLIKDIKQFLLQNLFI